MRTHIIEVTNGEQNWGKFLLGQMDAVEWSRSSEVDKDPPGPLLRKIGWGPHDDSTCLVLDLQTCEGAIFHLRGRATPDLNKHRVWVCPMFEPFLEWLYARYQAASAAGERYWWEALPRHVDLPDAPFAMNGYRREGTPDER